ncbi:MAG: hypothetical protein ACR2GP_15670 [Burkholderiaceae bacterium]
MSADLALSRRSAETAAEQPVEALLLLDIGFDIEILGDDRMAAGRWRKHSSFANVLRATKPPTKHPEPRPSPERRTSAPLR